MEELVIGGGKSRDGGGAREAGSGWGARGGGGERGGVLAVVEEVKAVVEMMATM